MNRILPVSLLLLGGTFTAQSALTVTLHLGPNNSTIVSIVGSGTTAAVASSGLATTGQEQWGNLTGNPFVELGITENADFTFSTPISIAPGVNATGIQVDDDGLVSGNLDGTDDFRLFLDNPLPTSQAYSANGVSTLTTNLPFSTALRTGSYSDDADGGSLFLQGFGLEITTVPAPIPEPSSALLLCLASMVALSRRR